MIDDVNNIINNQVSVNGTGKKEVKNNTPSFKGNPAAVDTTPAADVYQSQPPAAGAEKQESPLSKAAYIIPTWYILNKGTQLFDKSCGGDYEKSLVGRLGAFGDRVSDTKLVKNGLVDKLNTYGTTIKKNIMSYVNKHPLLSAMAHTPTKPENSMPKSFMETQSEADIKEAANKLKQFVEKKPKSLKDAGATKDEIKALKSKFGTDFLGRIKNQEAAIQEFQLTKLGGDGMLGRISSREATLGKQLERYKQFLSTLPEGDARIGHVAKRISNIEELQSGYKSTILKNLKLEKLGLGKNSYEALQNEPVKGAKLLESALEKGKKYFPKFSESFNKLKSIHAPKTALGKLFPKLAKLGMRGLTFGGGLVNTAFIAFGLADSIKNTVEAPKEQKTGTMAAGILETLSWVVSMPLALGAMHRVSGLQYTGLSKDSVNAFRTAQKSFNAKAKAGGFASEAAYNGAKEAVNSMKNVTGKQGWFTKAAKGFGKFIGIGLEQFTPYKKSLAGLSGKAKWTARLGNIGKAAPNFLRNCVGYPLRFGLYMAVFAPIVDKLFSGITSAIFGKPYDPEKIKEEKEKEAQKQAMLYPGPRMLPNPQAATSAGTVDLNTLSDNNLIKQKITGVKPAPAAVSPQGGNGSNTPFMPPIPQGTQNGNNSAPTAQQSGNNAADPNKSEYDTVPRNYVPQINFNAPFKFSDPMANPASDRNYDSAQALADKSDKLGDDVEAFLNEK